MFRDPADDGQEVKLIAFFRMYPQGSYSRRVKDVSDSELRMRFILYHAKTVMRQARKFIESL